MTKPGVYFPNINYSLTELIATAGMSKLTANASKVYVIREDYDSFLKINVFDSYKNLFHIIIYFFYLLFQKCIYLKT